MTEPEWMEQLESLLASVSEESAQRFSAACCRRNWDFMIDARHRAVVEASERLIDGRITEAEFDQTMGPVVELWAEHPPRWVDNSSQWDTFQFHTAATRHLGKAGGAEYAARFAALAAASRAGEEGSQEYNAAWSKEIDAQLELAATLLVFVDPEERRGRPKKNSLHRYWKPLDAETMAAFAEEWLKELRGDQTEGESKIGQAVVMMNFVAPPDQQWMFIRAAVAEAATDDELGHIAAGPFEHILGHHGDEYISVVEEEAAGDTKFARMVTGAWKYMMSDEVWERVQAIQARVTAPLQQISGDR